MLKPFAICSFGRSGSTLLSNILARDPNLTPIDELIEPLSANRFLSTDICTSSEFWQSISQDRPSYIDNLWQNSLNNEVLFTSPTHRSKVLLSYCLPRLTNSPLQLYDQLEQRYCHSSEIKRYRDFFLDFCYYLLLNQPDSGTFFERTGGGAHFMQSLYSIFEGRILLSLRNLESTILSKASHSVCRQFALNHDLPITEQKYVLVKPADSCKIKHQVIRLLIKWYSQVFSFLSDLDSPIYSVDYSDFCHCPLGVLNQVYEVFNLGSLHIDLIDSIPAASISEVTYYESDFRDLLEFNQYYELKALDRSIRSLTIPIR